VSELLFVVGYAVALLVSEFANSEWRCLPFPSLNFIVLPAKGLQTSFWDDRAAHLASCKIVLVTMNSA